MLSGIGRAVPMGAHITDKLTGVLIKIQLGPLGTLERKKFSSRVLFRVPFQVFFESHQISKKGMRKTHARSVPVNTGLDFDPISSIVYDVFDSKYNLGFRDCWGASSVFSFVEKTLLRCCNCETSASEKLQSRHCSDKI